MSPAVQRTKLKTVLDYDFFLNLKIIDIEKPFSAFPTSQFQNSYNFISLNKGHKVFFRSASSQIFKFDMQYCSTNLILICSCHKTFPTEFKILVPLWI